MGGKGSTRWEQHKKKVPADRCLALSIIDLVRAGFDPAREHRTAILRWEDPVTQRAQFSAKLTPEGDSDAPVLRLDYVVTRGAKERQVHEIIELVTTCPAYGGRRWWFQCSNCSRRCSKLFVLPDGWEWACRFCHNLGYASAQTAHEDDRGDPHKQVFALLRRFHELDQEIEQCKRWSKRKRRLVLEYRRTYDQLKELLQKADAESIAMLKEHGAIQQENGLWVLKNFSL